MTFEVFIHKKAEKKISSLSPQIKEWVKCKLKEFSKDPFAFDVKKLKDAGEIPKYRLRIGDYRAIFIIDYDARKIYIMRFFHRSEGYEKFLRF